MGKERKDLQAKLAKAEHDFKELGDFKRLVEQQRDGLAEDKVKLEKQLEESDDSRRRVLEEKTDLFFANAERGFEVALLVSELTSADVELARFVK